MIMLLRRVRCIPHHALEGASLAERVQVAGHKSYRPPPEGGVTHCPAKSMHRGGGGRTVSEFHVRLKVQIGSMMDGEGRAGNNAFASILRPAHCLRREAVAHSAGLPTKRRRASPALRAATHT